MYSVKKTLFVTKNFDVRSLLRAHDVDGDGRLSWPEFRALMLAPIPAEQTGASCVAQSRRSRRARCSPLERNDLCQNCNFRTA